MIRRLNAGLLLISFAILFTTCTRMVPDSVLSIIQEVREKHAPEKRVAIFDVKAEIKNGGLVLSGEVSSPDAESELIDRLTKLNKFKITNRITVLPQPELGEETYGVIRISTAQLRRTADIESEMTSEAIMGSEVRLMRLPSRGKDSWWRYCQAEDDYLGWIMLSSMSVGDESFINTWRNKDKVIVTATYSKVLEAASEDAPPVSDLVFLNKLINVKKVDSWYAVELPDGRTGFVKAADVMEESDFLNRQQATAEQIIRTATTFMGIPYLWGGTSVKGFDCSGFTQTTFKFNGIRLPRDANMQVLVGTPVPIEDGLQNLKPADLLFWGPRPDRITHVGIYLGEDQFIHSDGMVHVKSFDPADKLYSESRHRTLRAARRILNN